MSVHIVGPTPLSTDSGATAACRASDTKEDLCLELFCGRHTGYQTSGTRAADVSIHHLFYRAIPQP